jgi:hypothetical protein
MNFKGTSFEANANIAEARAAASGIPESEFALPPGDITLHRPPGGSSFSTRRLALWACFMLLVLFATRLDLMTRSLYRDEAWVVTSVLSPSPWGMFHYDRWLQTSPPLFLLSVRAAVRLFGDSEIAFRVVPWLAGALSVLCFGSTLSRLFPPTFAMMGTSLYLTNYWALKYSQQVKQYSTDLLVSSLFLFLLTSYLIDGRKRATFVALLFTGGVGVFLSYTAVFWFPVSLIVIAFAASNGRASDTQKLDASFANRSLECVIAFLVYASCFGVVHRFFILPSRSAGLVQFWANSFIGSGGLLLSLLRFFQNVCDLVLPQLFLWSRFLSYACGTVILIGVFRALRLRGTASEPAATILAITAVPVATAVTVSGFRQYPLLHNPRMIIWILPICILLLVYGLQPAWTWLTPKVGARASELSVTAVTVLICLVATSLGVFVVEKGRANPLDDFRSATLYLSTHALPHDSIFVYALGVEELSYYSHRLHWYPASVFAGNTNLGCCLPGAPIVPSDDLRKAGLLQDVRSFVHEAKGNNKWFLLQSGLHQELIAEHARSEAIAMQCRETVTSKFESTLVLGFDCSSQQSTPGLR